MPFMPAMPFMPFMADRPCMPSGMLAASQAERAREQTNQRHQKGDFQGGLRFRRRRRGAGADAGPGPPGRGVSGVRVGMVVTLAGQAMACAPA